MSGWLARSLAALELEARDWPDWKREAAGHEPYIAIPSQGETMPAELSALLPATKEGGDGG